MGVWSLTPPLSARVVLGLRPSRSGSGAGPASARPITQVRANRRQRGLATSFRQQHNQRGLPHRSCSGQGPLHYRLPSSFALPGCDEEHLASSWPTAAHYLHHGRGPRGSLTPITERPLQLFHHVPSSAQPLPTINTDAPKRLSNAPSAPPNGHTETTPPSYHIPHQFCVIPAKAGIQRGTARGVPPLHRLTGESRYPGAAARWGTSSYRRKACPVPRYGAGIQGRRPGGGIPHHQQTPYSQP